MKRRSRAPQRADRRGGQYVLIPHAVLRSEAYRTSSFRSRALLIAMVERFNGNNNGRIGFSVREMADALGCRNYGSNSRAVGDLVARGLVSVERSGDRGSSKSREFRITFISTGEGPGQAATNDYIHWQEGDAGTRKKAVVKSTAKHCVNVAETAAGAKLSDAKATVVHRKDRSFSAVAGNNTVVDFAAHIGNHPNRVPPINVRRSRSPWPDTEALRERVSLVIRDLGRGTQSRIASTAQIPAGTFSKFLHRNGGLPEDASRRLALALARFGQHEETA